MCLYSYAGKEHQTDEFSWLLSNGIAKLERNEHENVICRLIDSAFGSPKLPPENAIRTGFQKGVKDFLNQESSGNFYNVLADTSNGLLAAKANAVTGQCLYPYQGKEYSASEYYWIVVEGSYQSKNLT